jgi:hypothetical protein
MYELLEYARRGRNDWWRYLVTPVMAFVLVVLVELIADRWVVSSGLLPPGLQALTRNPAFPDWYFGAKILQGLSPLLCLLASLLIVHHKHVEDIAGNWSWGQVGVAAAVGFLISVVSTGLDYLLQPGGFRLTIAPQTPTLFLVFAPYCLLGAFTIVLLTCGYWAQGVLLATKRPLVTSVLVGAFSILGSNSLPHAVNSFAWGIASVLIAIRTSSIAWSFGLIVGSEAFAPFVIDSSDDTVRGAPGIVTQTTPELAWLDAVVFSLLLAALCVWIARRYPTRQPTADVFS